MKDLLSRTEWVGNPPFLPHCLWRSSIIPSLSFYPVGNFWKEIFSLHDSSLVLESKLPKPWTGLRHPRPTASVFPCVQHPLCPATHSHLLASERVCRVARAVPEAKVTQLQREPWLHSLAPNCTLHQLGMPPVRGLDPGQPVQGLTSVPCFKHVSFGQIRGTVFSWSIGLFSNPTF
jgi:hypothetical protein